MPRVYTSPYPDVPIPRRSIFTHIFSRSHHPDLPAYIDAPTGKTLSRADVLSQSLQVAWSLRNILRAKKGDVMAIYSPNSLWWPIVLLGGVAAGLRITTVNSGYTPMELAHHLEDSHAHHIFVHPSLLNNTRKALEMMGVDVAEIRERIVLADSVGSNAYKGAEGWQQAEQLLGQGQLEKEEPFDGDAADETVFLCYSSGTTSKSKGVELTHYNIVSVTCMVERDFRYLSPNKSMLLSVLPFYHIYGLVKHILNPFFLGAPQAIMSQFIPEVFCANIERYKVTVLFIVPPMLVVVANHPVLEKYDLRSVRTFFIGAAPLAESLMLAVVARFRNLGANVICIQAYGLTEMSPTTHILPDSHVLSKVGSVGLLLPNLQARLVLDDGVTDAPEGEPGELWLKGPTVMKGYLNNPRATIDAITPDGWLLTGDVALVDKDGFFKIVDRKKELIKYKGFQVPPADLEAVLLSHPNVLDTAVIGVWSEAEATEYPRAYVVPRGGLELFKSSAEREAYAVDVQMWMHDKVAKHKYLRGGVVLTDVIPKSAAGKILRRELRELAKKDLHVAGASQAKL